MSCTIEDCTDVAHCRGWCRSHYARWRRHGDPRAGRQRDIVKRFFAKVDKRGECWIWTASGNAKGYGHFTVKRRTTYAHRWSYEHHIGPIPESLVIDHLCRNRACVNPGHLEAVTYSENNSRGLLGWGRSDTCRKGHDITDPANVYVGPKYRTCRICRGR